MDRFSLFEEQFVQDLEHRITKPLYYSPLEIWSPKRLASPERHIQLGLLTGHSIQQIKAVCESNQAFLDIESMLGVQYTFQEYEIHPVGEQIWLWSYEKLREYMKLLSMPGAIRSDFYKKNHDRFIDLLRLTFSEDPLKRPTFASIYRSWCGDHAKIDQQQDTTVESASSPVSSDVPHPVSLPSHRLVLTSRLSSGERSKTRKNLRS